MPLHCNWYLVGRGDAESGAEGLKEIPEVTGACYQPCVDDVGWRVMVHAVPASDAQEYRGMPLLREVGPIVMDRSIRDCVDVLKDENPVVFQKVSIEKLEHDQDSECLPAGQASYHTVSLRIQPH